MEQPNQAKRTADPLAGIGDKRTHKKTFLLPPKTEESGPAQKRGRSKKGHKNNMRPHKNLYNS